MRPVRSTFILELFIALPTLMIVAAFQAGRSRPDLANWENLKTLTENQSVQVVRKDGGQCRGETRLVTAEAIVVRVGNADRAFPRERVLSVLTPEESPRARNAAELIRTGTPGVRAGALAPSREWRPIYRAPQLPSTQSPAP